LLRKIFDFFFDKGTPFGQNGPTFFSQPDTIIYTPIESPCRV
jgi:hypothetical protein